MDFKLSLKKHREVLELEIGRPVDQCKTWYVPLDKEKRYDLWTPNYALPVFKSDIKNLKLIHLVIEMHNIVKTRHAFAIYAVYLPDYTYTNISDHF